MPVPAAADLLFVTALGLSGALHCAGMCGPLACSYTVPLGARAGGWRYHVAYYGGRFLAYAAIGALLGAAGGALLEVFHPGSPVRLAGRWAAGGVLVAAGLAILLGGGLPAPAERLLQRLMAPLTAPLRRLARAGGAGPWRAAPLGMLSGVLPCGMMWAAELKAAASGGLVAGLLLMAAFCAATSPSLAATGWLAGRLSPAFRGRLARASGLVIAAMGVHLVGFAHAIPMSG